jgi:lipooligosaccharide transport system ATP-binding protein
LIREHVEPHVLELQGEVANILPVFEGMPGVRVLSVGETHYCYAQELGPVLARLEAVPQLQYTHRVANLEDVFLKLTGHELRE